MPAIRLFLNSPYYLFFFFHLYIHTVCFTENVRDFEELSFAAGDMSFAIHQMKRCIATRLVMMKCYEPNRVTGRFSFVEDFFFVKLSE